jgi:hypothetical protein
MAVANSALITAMEALAQTDSPANRRALYSALLTSELLVPIAHPLANQKPGLQTVVGMTNVDFVVLQDPHNQTAMLAFTDEPAIRLWKLESSYIATNAVDLFAMALEMDVASIIMNIAGPTTRGELMRWEFQSLVNGVIPGEGRFAGTQVITPPPDAEVKFSRLAHALPANLLAGIQQAFASRPEIAAGYVMQAQIDEGEPHLVAGVQFGTALSDEAIREVMNDLGDKISAVLPEGEFIDFVVIDSELSVPIASASDALVFKR